MERYIRHLQLQDFGREAQDKLQKARVLIIGAGGLGCPVLMHLAAMGVGQLGIADGDVVALSNLHRQLLYTEKDIGRSKAAVACEKLLQMNSSLSVEIFPVFINGKNIFPILENFDLIVDGTDQMFTRFLINDACLVTGKPWVYGAVYQYEGQVSVFNVWQDGEYSVNFRDLYPDPTDAAGAVSCGEAGVLGIVPNFIGLLLANEVIKWITGREDLLKNRLLHYHLQNHRQNIFNIMKNNANVFIPDRATVENADYPALCNMRKAESSLDWKKIIEQDDTLVVDVRSANEEPFLGNYRHVKIPLSLLEEENQVLQPYRSLVFVCQSGVRSKKALELAKNIWPEKAVYHVESGIFELLKTIRHG